MFRAPSVHFCNPSPVVSFLPGPWGQRMGFNLLLTEGGGTLVFGVLVLGLLVLAGVLVLTRRCSYGVAWRLEVMMVELNVWQLVEVVIV